MTNIKVTQLPQFLLDQVRNMDTMLLTNILLVVAGVAAVIIVLDIITKNEAARKLVSDLFLMGIALWLCNKYDPDHAQLLLAGFLAFIALSVLSKRLQDLIENQKLKNIVKREFEILRKFLEMAIAPYIAFFKWIIKKLKREPKYHCDYDVLRAVDNIYPFPQKEAEQ